jgi:hypothetical protein
MGDEVLFSRGYNSKKFAKGVNMKHYQVFLAIAVLVLASLACQALSGGGNDAPPTENPEVLPVEPDGGAGGSGGGGGSVDTDFPLLPDAYNVTDVGDGSLLYYTKVSAEEALEFYRDEYTAKGYTERDINTVMEDGIFSVVFDGDPSGEAVVIQSVDLGDGSRTISIRLEDV